VEFIMSDLKEREYRDEQGNVRHHTRTYMEQHGRAAKGAERAEPLTEADESAEVEDFEEELEIQVNTLLALAQMDSEAAAAYETAAELVETEEVQSKLQEFADDHRRHIKDLGQLIQELGGQPRAAAAPPPDDSTFVMCAAALAALGTQGALLSLISSEQFTNSTYDAALNAVVAQDARALLERNFSDEQRHIAWLSQRARELGDLVDPTVGEDG
jgi:uncharacterized protein (TIGR02284 family)